MPALAAPIAWVEPSLTRVGPEAPAGSRTSIDLYAARGESESFQIIVRAPSGGLTGVNVIAPDLNGPQFTLYREHYVYLARGSGDWYTNRNKPLGAGWYPDGLIPFVNPATGGDLNGAALDAVPFNLSAGRNQPIWVDVFVPRGAAAGQYSGTFTVTSDQGQAQVALNLTVWDFTLPVKPALESSILYWAVRYQLQPGEELLRNRLMPTFVSASDAGALVSKGLGTANVGFWSGADGSNCTVSNPPPSASQVASVASLYPDGLHLYAYTADEIGHCSSLLSTMQAYASALRAAGVDQLITMAPRADWAGVVHIWVELPKQYVASDVQAAIGRGESVWSYNCLQQDDYSPKWLFDYAPINFRIQPGFINQSLGLTGLLYWRADLWSSDPWNDVTGYSASYPGEGLLVYPAQQVGLQGVVPSMRLKWLRDGADDYDYIALLKERGLQDWALGVARTVGPDWSNWTRDTSLLEAARRELGEKLNSLSSPHGLSATASATPSSVPSGGTASLEATATDSLGHGVAAWSWSDGGAGGAFSPSAGVRNPTYTAPANLGDVAKVITLTVTATCDGPAPATASASVALTVMPVEHQLSVTAAASPEAVPSGGTTSLSASAADSRGHAIVSWQWSDGGEGGSFSPSAIVQYPSYAAPENLTEADRVIALTVTAVCGGPTAISASGTAYVTVAPASQSLSVTAAPPVPSVVPSRGTAELSAAVSGSVPPEEVSWQWDDGGINGEFLPSPAVNGPLYRAPANPTGRPLTVTLTVTASYAGSLPVTASDSTLLTVEPEVPEPHALSVRAYVEPSVVNWKGRSHLTAVAEDSLGHAVATWYWSDGGAGGSFSPSNRVQDPTYRTEPNTTPGNEAITLSVTAVCGGPNPATGTGYALLSVEPKPNLKVRVRSEARAAEGIGETVFSVPDVSGWRPSDEPFSDVSAEFWAFDSILACYQAGIVSGYPDGSYRAELPVSRDEIAVYLSRAVAGEDALVPPGPPQPSFPDVPRSHWAYRYVEYARSLGIAGGFPDGGYHPAAPVDRAQMAAFVARAVSEPTGDRGLAGYEPPVIGSFRDVPADFWGYRYVEYLAARGAAAGYADGTYRPSEIVNRAQAAAYLAHAFGLTM